MNREVKFRGKTAKGEWLYGYYLEKELCDGAGRCAYIKFDGSQEVRVLKETVGQFTGLYDMNGKEIYEGDILKMGNQKACVRYGGCRFFAWYADWLSDYNGLCEIIGNIHDNRELLTVK
jgi:hypothetical protein